MKSPNSFAPPFPVANPAQSEIMVGRKRDGTPLVEISTESIAGIPSSPSDNHFNYDADPHGRQCPISSHKRRSNPRSGDFPPGVTGFWSPLIRILGFGRRNEYEDTIASSRFHRILRRGRTYGMSDANPGHYERCGNTKTHEIVKANVTILNNLPVSFRHGVFSEPATFDAWVRFSGPGPDVPADINDVGFGSMAVKLMGVAGEKLMDEEKHTQDLICVSTPTSVTPDIAANTRLQYWSLLDLPIFYFLDPRDSQVRNMLMHALWNPTLYNPLGTQYWSCVPYLLGENQAIEFAHDDACTSAYLTFART